MTPWETLARGTSPDGKELVLQKRGTEFVIRIAGHTLMSSRSHGSEEGLAEAGLEDVRTASARILVGGLGLGFTLRAVLERLKPEGRVTVAELVPAVVEWNRGVLAPLAASPLVDRRVTVFTGDVRKLMKQQEGTFHAVLLDVDNGPSALSHPSNAALYDVPGLRLAYACLKPHGRLVVWSAGPDERFERRLSDAYFSVQTRQVKAGVGQGARHTLFIGTRR